MKQKLESWNYQVLEADNLKEAREESFSRTLRTLLTLDIKLPDGSGIDFLKQAKQVQPGLPVIMIPAFGVLDLAVQALKLGAYDFIEKPIDFDKLGNSIRNASRNLPAQGSTGPGLSLQHIPLQSGEHRRALSRPFATCSR